MVHYSIEVVTYLINDHTGDLATRVSLGTFQVLVQATEPSRLGGVTGPPGRRHVRPPVADFTVELYKTPPPTLPTLTRGGNQEISVF